MKDNNNYKKQRRKNSSAFRKQCGENCTNYGYQVAYMSVQ